MRRVWGRRKVLNELVPGLLGAEAGLPGKRGTRLKKVSAERVLGLMQDQASSHLMEVLLCIFCCYYSLYACTM